jgi:uncharacterized coiled-coil protein SlyX
VPAFDAGDVLTVALAVLAAAGGWGASRQKILDLERRVAAHDGARDEVIRLQEQVRALTEALKDLREDLRLALRPERRPGEG